MANGFAKSSVAVDSVGEADACAWVSVLDDWGFIVVEGNVKLDPRKLVAKIILMVFGGIRIE
jgi:hypothetical protein